MKDERLRKVSIKNCTLNEDAKVLIEQCKLYEGRTILRLQDLFFNLGEAKREKQQNDQEIKELVSQLYTNDKSLNQSKLEIKRASSDYGNKRISGQRVDAEKNLTDETEFVEEIKTIGNNIDDIKKVMSGLRARIDVLERRNEKLTSDIEIYKRRIKILNAYLRRLQRRLRDCKRAVKKSNKELLKNVFGIINPNGYDSVELAKEEKILRKSHR